MEVDGVAMMGQSGKTRVLVAFKELEQEVAAKQEGETPRDRRAAYLARRERTKKALGRLLVWLDERSLLEEIYNVGEPNAFHVVALECSERVAAILHRVPEVEVVAPADMPMGLAGASKTCLI